MLPVRISGTVLKEGTEVIGTAAFLQDLREYKQLEKEKLDNERLAAVGSTVAQLAHGIKNILTGLQGGMYVIKSGIKKGSTERTNKGWEMLERNVERITVLVKGFSEFFQGTCSGSRSRRTPTGLRRMSMNCTRTLPREERGRPRSSNPMTSRAGEHRLRGYAHLFGEPRFQRASTLVRHPTKEDQVVTIRVDDKTIHSSTKSPTTVSEWTVKSRTRFLRRSFRPRDWEVRGSV